MLYYKATAGCGLGWVGVPGACAPPPSAYLSWVTQRRRCAVYRPSMISCRPPHTHRPHPYPLFHRPPAALLIVQVSYSFALPFPRAPPRRRHVIPPRFANPAPRSSFPLLYHTPESCGICQNSPPTMASDCHLLLRCP